MTAFPSTFAEVTRALPAAGLGEKATQAIQQLAGKGYEVHTGLTEEFAQAIARMTQEPSIRLYCPRDAGERFTDQAATERWLAKERAVFLLLKRADDGSLGLAGYGWAGAGTTSQVPGGEITFAIRVGEAGQGQGLATPFAWLIVAASAASYGAKNMWLETWASNGGAVHIYHKIGFVTVAEVPGKRAVPDSGPADDIRVYMSLANELLPDASSASA
jgi:ribosomal protein S18 acetylase RimI-like enzyme